MTILLFVLTAVLVGYVVYTFYSSDAGQSSSHPTGTEPEAPAQPAPAQKPTPKAKKPAAAKPAEPAKAETEPVTDSTESGESGPTQYRNPETGETAAIPSNYRFAKRWIKEALVAEGLLDKVYKNNELDRNASKKVKTALDKLKEIEKYHA